MYGWGNHNCESEMPFICEVVAGEVPPTTLEPPTAPPTMPCRVRRFGSRFSCNVIVKHNEFYIL